jgi:hypothetical protein
MPATAPIARPVSLAAKATPTPFNTVSASPIATTSLRYRTSPWMPPASAASRIAAMSAPAAMTQGFSSGGSSSDDTS